MRIFRVIIILQLTIWAAHANKKTPYKSPKQKAVDKLVELIINPNETENLRKDLLLKIQSGLALSNNAIFEELLQETGSGDKSYLIREYQKIEAKMNSQIALSFAKHIDIDNVIREINAKVYAKHYTRAELEALVRFYSGTLGKKFLRVSKSMVEQTQTLSAETLIPLSLKVTQEVQALMQTEVGKLIQADLQKSWDEE
tara:strand:- start:497 stop:1093 length:597 start_codon:yes stop_codon:yes gene_type:complete